MKKLLEAVSRFWRSFRVFAGVLSLIRFQLIVLLIELILVIKVDQIRDIIIAYGSGSSGHGGVAWLVWLFVAMQFCALVIWYTARIMFRFRFDEGDSDNDPSLVVSPSDKDSWPRLKKHLPRWLGASVFLIMGLGVVALTRSGSFEPLVLLICLGVSLMAFFMFVIYRRALFRINPYATERKDNNLGSRKELSLTIRVLFWLLLALNVLVLVAVAYFPHAVADILGPGAIIFLGGGLLVFTGSSAVYWANWFRVPIVTIALLVAVLSSFVDDNHLVRLCSGMPSHDGGYDCPTTTSLISTYRNDTIAGALGKWIEQRAPSQKHIPLFIVAAEGGGIRAAYWAATVLGELHDRSLESVVQGEGRDLAFSNQVFAISGVSGGTLGAAVYSALIDARPHAGSQQNFRARAQRVLSKDFLSPTIATMFFPDLLQRFVFVPFLDDRAMTMEETWERAWHSSEGTDVFADPYDALWSDANARRPLLFANATIVEAGKRLIMSPTKVPDGRTLRWAFSDSVHGMSLFPTTIPLSTAVHLSARFPYVSPVGLVERQDVDLKDPLPNWLRIADGGYFENAAAATALEILNVVRGEEKRLEGKFDITIDPYVIKITNSSVGSSNNCLGDEQSAGSRERSKNRGKRKWLSESMSPLIALMNVRTGHASLASCHLKAAVLNDHFTEFQLHDNGVLHPLGWLLSRPSREDMSCQVEGYGTEQCPTDELLSIKDSVEKLNDVLDFLNESPTE